MKIFKMKSLTAYFPTWRTRLRPVLSLLFGVAVGTFVFLQLNSAGYERAAFYVEKYSLENQIRDLFAHPDEVDQLQSHFLGREVAKQRRVFCLGLARSFFLTDDAVPKLIPDKTRTILLKSKECNFYVPSIQEYIATSSYLESAVIFGASTAISGMFLFWMFTFPHIGWRRLALVTSTLVGSLVGLRLWFQDEYVSEELLATVLLSSIFSGCFLLLFRNACVWVSAGFKKSG